MYFAHSFRLFQIQAACHYLATRKSIFTNLSSQNVQAGYTALINFTDCRHSIHINVIQFGYNELFSYNVNVKPPIKSFLTFYFSYLFTYLFAPHRQIFPAANGRVPRLHPAANLHHVHLWLPDSDDLPQVVPL